MNDILEQLSHPVLGDPYKPHLIIWEMCNQRRAAAEEIRRLRAALQSIADFTPGTNATALLLRGYARMALENA